jgi:hypothetical protein
MSQVQSHARTVNLSPFLLDTLGAYAHFLGRTNNALLVLAVAHMVENPEVAVPPGSDSTAVVPLLTSLRDRLRQKHQAAEYARNPFNPELKLELDPEPEFDPTPNPFNPRAYNPGVNRK